MKARRAAIRISETLLKQVLDLPPEYVVVGLKWDGFTGTGEIALAGDKLPEVAEGEQLRVYLPEGLPR